MENSRKECDKVVINYKNIFQDFQILYISYWYYSYLKVLFIVIIYCLTFKL